MMKNFELRPIGGELTFIGHGVLPPACYAASELLQRFHSLLVSDLMFCNFILSAMKDLDATVLFPHLTEEEMHDLNLLTFTEVSHGKTAYGQTVIFPDFTLLPLCTSILLIEQVKNSIVLISLLWEQKYCLLPTLRIDLFSSVNQFKIYMIFQKFNHWIWLQISLVFLELLLL